MAALYAIVLLIAMRERITGKPIWRTSFQWVSTLQSVHAGEISILALLETLISMFMALLVAVDSNRWLHIVAGACSAPVFLLRTERSNSLALRWWDRMLFGLFGVIAAPRDWLDQEDQSDTPARRIPLLLLVLSYYRLLLAMIGASAVLAKSAATMVCLVRHPLEALIAFPENWRRAMFCIDIVCDPEPIPGLESQSERFPRRYRRAQQMRYSVFREQAKRDPRSGNLMMVLLTLHAPAIMYRLLLKSTAVVWLPFLWIAWRTSSTLPLRTRLKLIVRDSFGRVVLWYSVGVMLLFFLKISVYNRVASVVESWQRFPLSAALDFYVDQYRLPWWQLASGVNAVFAILLFVLASRQLLLIEERVREEAGMRWVDGIIRAMTFVRSTLATYVIGCTFYITIREATRWKLPPLGEKLFPWP